MSPNELTLETLIGKSELQSSCELDGLTVMVSIQDGSYLGANQVGAEIWKLLDQPLSLAQIIREMTREYEVSPEECEKSVRDFLEKLHQRQLIVFENAR